MSESATDAAAEAPALRRKGDREAAEREARIYQQVLDAIMDRRLPPGTKLPENELAQIFGTSRSRVRRILARLAQDRMVAQVLNRGSFVARPSLEDAREVFEARRAIEESIIRRVAHSCTAADLHRLRGHVAKERAAAERRNVAAMVRLSGEFHIILADVAANRTLAGFLRELVARSSLVVALYEHAASADCSHVEHGEILDAVAAADPAAAAACMGRHLSEIEGRLRLNGDEASRIDLRRIFQHRAGPALP